jgi:hypothetical protein
MGMQRNIRPQTDLARVSIVLGEKLNFVATTPVK